MPALRIFRRLRELFDVDVTTTPPADGDVLTYVGVDQKWEPGVGGAGATGATGATGAGATGATGATGTLGVDGATGATGATGAGTTGATGATGVDGATGATGASGSGSTGATGTAGATGATGSAGTQGATGATGSGGTGATGATGTAGSQGATGATGAAGTAGATGATGTAGTQGATGATGTAGTAGATGATGTAGTQGATGATGAGVTGATGATGTAGTIGATGATGSGTTGATGAAGTQGATGATGAQGNTGATGAGATGATGAFGGDSFAWTFDTATAGDEATGNLRLNNATIGSVTEIAASIVECNGTNVLTWLLSLDDASAAIRGRLKLWQKSDPTKWATFDITGNSGSTGGPTATVYFSVTYVAGPGGFGTSSCDLVMSFAHAGNDGATGAQGSTGATGAGTTGATGTAGATGSTGATGAGTTGATGATGTLGVDGATGATGPAGAGTTGATGATGATGPAGVDGATGATGARPSGSLYIPASAMWPSITNGSSGPLQVETATNKVNYWVMDFADAATRSAECRVSMPSDWDGGTVTAVFKWLANDATTNAAVWGAQGTAFSDGDALDTAFGGQQTVTDANASTANQERVSAATSAITIQNTPAASDDVHFRFQRLGSDGSDSLAATARLLGVVITFTRA